jgi:Spy/CpxP family protein refolding chaperone
MAAVLAAGLGIGFAASTIAYRFRLLRVPGGNLIERMDRSLALDPAQREQIAGVMEDARDHAMLLRRELQRQRRHLMIDAYLKIRSILRPDQQKKFDDEFIPPRFRAEASRSEQPGALAWPSPSP